MSRLPVVHSVAPQFLNFMISRFLVSSICEIVSLAYLMTIRFINSRFFTMPTKAMSRDPANLQVLIGNKINPVGQASIGESV